MKTHTKDDNLDFEAWSRLLLCRKVPDDYHHLINSDVVHNGAVILERGDAFEVRVTDRIAHEQILVTPFPALVPGVPAERHWRI